MIIYLSKAKQLMDGGCTTNLVSVDIIRLVAPRLEEISMAREFPNVLTYFSTSWQKYPQNEKSSYL